MTQVITRYFENAETATKAKKVLQYEGFPPGDLKVFDDAGTVAAALTASQVNAATAQAYKIRLADGGAVLLARASYIPLRAAKLVRDVTAELGAADMGRVSEVAYIVDKPGRASPIFLNHPRFLTRMPKPGTDTFHMANWPIPLISRRKPYDEFDFPRHARMADWPIGLISRRKPFSKSIFSRHARMANFPIRLISKRVPKDRFAFPRHARMANVFLPLTNRRKPFSETLIGRHTRMARWPFPLLINGKMGENALMPGAPRMANFPIPLLSDRKPADKFAFPRHARMANFPIPLTNRRKPWEDFAFPRHARMANVFLPLVIKHAASDASGFSFSKLVGWSTKSDPSGR